MIRRGSFLSNGWLVTGASLAAVGVLVVLLWSMGHRPSISGASLRVFCAAGARPPLHDIIREYEDAYDATIQADYGPTGELMASMSKIGMKGDLFVSADSETMRDAQRLGLVAEALPIARIRTVLVVNRKTQEKLTQQGKAVTGLADLLRPDLKVALANEAAAIGKAGRLVLQAHGLWDHMEQRRKTGKLSNFPTVNKVVETVALNEGYLGIAWDSTAQQNPHVVMVPLAKSQERVEHMEIGVLKKSADPAGALRFARYVAARNKGLKTFAAHHFDVISDGDMWEPHTTIQLYAGAMLRPGLEQVIKSFERREGVKVLPVYNGCGILVTTMEALARKKGRFPDGFVSCDLSFTDKVADYFESAAGKARATDIITENDLVMIVPKANEKGITSLDDLRDRDRLKQLKIGLPHPHNSAIGFLIRKMFIDLGFPEEAYDSDKNPRVKYTDSADRLVLDIGALDVALVGKSNAVSVPRNEETRLTVIPLDAGAKATQTFSIARETQHRYLMRRFFQTLTSPESKERFRQAGFRVRGGP